MNNKYRKFMLSRILSMKSSVRVYLDVLCGELSSSKKTILVTVIVFDLIRYHVFSAHRFLFVMTPHLNSGAD